MRNNVESMAAQMRPEVEQIVPEIRDAAERLRAALVRLRELGIELNNAQHAEAIARREAFRRGEIAEMRPVHRSVEVMAGISDVRRNDVLREVELLLRDFPQA